MFIDYPKIITELTAVPVKTLPQLTFNGLNFLKVFIAEKGRDNSIVTFTDPVAFVNEYFGDAEINFKKHGQHPYDILNILENGGTVQCLRVSPTPSSGPANLTPVELLITPATDAVTFVIDDTYHTVTGAAGEAVTAVGARFDNITTIQFKLTVATAKLKNTQYLTTGQTVNITLPAAYAYAPQLVLTVKKVTVSGADTVILLDSALTLTQSGFISAFKNIITATVPTALTIVPFSPAVLSNAILGLVIDEKLTGSDTLPLALVARSHNTLGTSEDLEEILFDAANDDIYLAEIEECIHSTIPKKIFNFLGISAKGRGSYYNDFGFTLSNPIPENLDKYPFFTYKFSVYKKNKIGVKSAAGEDFVVALDPNAMDAAGNSMFIGHVLSTYLSEYNVCYSEVAIQKAIAHIRTLNTPSTFVSENLTMGVLDPVAATACVNGNDMYSEALATLQGKLLLLTAANITTDTTFSGTYPTAYISNPTGTPVNTNAGNIPMQFGSNGSLSTTVYNTAFRNIVNALYKNAFNGFLTDHIYDDKQFPVDIILDGGYHSSVKEQIKYLLTNVSRKHTIAILDPGIVYNTAAQDVTTFSGYNDYRIALYGNSREILDPYTKRNIRVFMPYFLINVLLNNYKHQEGLGRAVAGRTFGNIEKGIPNSLAYNPATDTVLSNLFKNKVNYATENFNGCKFMSQSTSQKKEDALSEIPNVILIHRLIKELMELSEDFQFSRNKPEKIANFQQLLNDTCGLFQVANNVAIEKVVAEVSQTEYDKLHKIARVRVAVDFYNFIYTVVMSFTVA
jgi:hypothetical protein